MQQIIAFVVSIVTQLVQACQSNIILQWTLYTFVFFSILFAFKVIFSFQVDHYREKETSYKEPTFHFTDHSQKLLTGGRGRKSK